MDTTKPERNIEVKCTGASELSIENMEGLQEGLKTIDEDSLRKLCGEIDSKGFNEPIAIWSDGKTNWILNGHQRLAALKQLETEGYKIPAVPICWVHAKSINEARRKILSLASQYGEVTHNGLRKFAQGSEMTMQEVAGRFRFPEIDWGVMAAESELPELPAPGGGTGGGSSTPGGSAGRFVLIYKTTGEREEWLRRLGLDPNVDDIVKAGVVGSDE